MDAIELNAALYAKMEAEMTDFANWLLKQPPEVILNHAIEYATKFDIVSIMETTDLSVEKARALLSLEEPLDAIYKDYGESSSNSLDVLVSFIEDKADELLSANQANAAVQVYPYSGEVAEREGDLEWYRQSHKLNIACKNEIEWAIAQNYSSNTLNDEAVHQVVAQFGFLYTKEEYLRKTGRLQGDNDVIGYHLRQSFRPGEITPEEANRLGCELAKRFTKGRHAFIVCTHVDKAHIHNHIIWNSTSLDADRKFRNFWGSSRAIRRLNDTICVQNGYSIVADPKKHSGKSYNKWLGDKKKLSHRERICLAIDDALAQNPKSFEALVELLKQAGYQVKDGKVPSLLGGDQKRFLRMDTLGEAYSPEALRAIIKGSRKHIPKVKLAEVVEETPVENLIDFVQEKLTRKNSAGRSKIHSVSNLKRLASSLLYLQENGLLDRTTLEEKVAEVSQRFSKLNSQIKQIEGQLDENAKMQQHIIDYKKTRDVYMAYHKAGYSQKFLSEHESDIIKHKAAKKFFDDRGMTKWPKIKKLRADFDELVAKKRTLNAERKKVEKEVRELQMAQYFVDRAYGDAEKTEKERKTVLR